MQKLENLYSDPTPPPGMIHKLDELGNPMYDDNGEPIYEPSHPEKPS